MKIIKGKVRVVQKVAPPPPLPSPYSTPNGIKRKDLYFSLPFFNFFFCLLEGRTGLKGGGQYPKLFSSLACLLFPHPQHRSHDEGHNFIPFTFYFHFIFNSMSVLMFL